MTSAFAHKGGGRTGAWGSGRAQHSDSGVAVDAASKRAPLERGAARDQILFLDAQSGIAGDMTIAALIDLGVPLSIVEDCVLALGFKEVRARATRTFAGAVASSQFEVEAGGPQVERSHADIEHLLAHSQLDHEVKLLAQRIFLRLAEAEATVHGIDLAQVHFHEVGAVDAIVDIVGAAACLQYLGARVMASPLPMGRGSVECRHGVLPLPAPATVLCLRGVPTYPANIEAELVTPTGAAIVATVAEEFCDWPRFAPTRTGYGSGSQQLEGRFNALRAVLGVPSPSDAETHVVIEANVDDLTGELGGHVMTQLFEAGAVDVWSTPTIMKKGRPGLVMSAIAPKALQQAVAQAFLRESTTIGVRHYDVGRIERPRRVVTVATPYGDVPVKISEGAFGPAQFKPEFDRCAELAKAANVPVRVVVAAALEMVQTAK